MPKIEHLLVAVEKWREMCDALTPRRPWAELSRPLICPLTIRDGRGQIDGRESSGLRPWDGLESQLTSYMVSDRTYRGWYVPVRFGDSPTEISRQGDLANRVNEVRRDTGFDIRAIAIDAREPAAASKIRQHRR